MTNLKTLVLAVHDGAAELARAQSYIQSIEALKAADAANRADLLAYVVANGAADMTPEQEAETVQAAVESVSPETIPPVTYDTIVQGLEAINAALDYCDRVECAAEAAPIDVIDATNEVSVEDAIAASREMDEPAPLRLRNGADDALTWPSGY